MPRYCFVGVLFLIQFLFLEVPCSDTADDSGLSALNLQYLVDDVALCMQQGSSQTVNNNLVIGKRNKSSKEQKKKMFALFYGYYAVEVMNSVSNDEITKILSLVNCLAKEENLKHQINLSSNSTQFSNRERNRYLHHTIKKVEEETISVSYLNGFLQLLLPDVHRSILTAANLGVRKAHWSQNSGRELFPSIAELGIRTIQLHSIDIAGMEEYQEQLRKKVEERERSSGIVIGGPKQPKPTPPPVEERLKDPDSDDFAAHYLATHYGRIPHQQRSQRDLTGEQEQEMAGEEEEDDNGSVYTMFILLSDRKEFAGGEVWVSNERHPSHTDSGDEHDEEEADDEEGSSLLKKSLVTRFTPEKGSMILLQSEKSHGHGPLVVGHRDMLVLELWPFTDAPVGSKRPALTEAQSFSPSHDFRLDL